MQKSKKEMMMSLYKKQRSAGFKRFYYWLVDNPSANQEASDALDEINKKYMKKELP